VPLRMATAGRCGHLGRAMRGSPHLRSMIIAALDTGMRRGEMLALRFGDVDSKRRVIVLRGETTKSRRTRVVPIGTSRLPAVLEWLRLDSTGEHKSDELRVFSEVTESSRVGSWYRSTMSRRGPSSPVFVDAIPRGREAVSRPPFRRGPRSFRRGRCRVRLRRQYRCFPSVTRCESALGVTRRGAVSSPAPP
jgi:integrase